MVSVGLFLHNFQDFIAPKNIINNFKTSHWLSTNCICLLASTPDCNYFRINYRKDTKLQNVALTRVDCKSIVYHMFVFFILRNTVPSEVCLFVCFPYCSCFGNLLLGNKSFHFYRLK